MDHVLKTHPIVKSDFVRGEGCYLYDAEGRQFLDFESGIWCTCLGHCHPRINAVIRRQVEQVMHLGTFYPNELVEDAAQEVLEIAGIREGKCIFLTSGSEAVEFAVQAVRRIIGKPLLLTLHDSFLSSFGSAGKRTPAEWRHFDWSACPVCPEQGNCDAQCSFLNDIPFEKIGGLVFEPGSASGWVRFPPKALIQALVKRVREQGGLVIANEVTTGIGRTGEWYGFQHYGLEPDLVASGKGLGNGYPVSAVAMTAETASRLEGTSLHYAQSHQNDPLGCAVAREVIRVLREEKLVERSRRVGNQFQARLRALQAVRPEITVVRGRGLMIAIDVDNSREEAVAWKLYHALLMRGFVVGRSSSLARANFLRFDPALSIEEREIDRLIENLDQVIQEEMA